MSVQWILPLENDQLLKFLGKIMKEHDGLTENGVKNPPSFVPSHYNFT